MRVAEYHDWLLEVAESDYRSDGTRFRFAAWVSDPARVPVGYGRGLTQSQAVTAAIYNARNNTNAHGQCCVQNLDNAYWTRDTQAAS